MTRRPIVRRGAYALEAGLVLPVVVFMFLAIVILGMAVFREQQVACLAQEASRYASVHGGDYEKDMDTASPTAASIVAQTITPKLAGMDPSQVNVSIEWIDESTGTSTDWDSASRDVLSISPTGEYVTNSVRVTVRYTWAPGVLFGSFTHTCVSRNPMSY